MFNFGEHFVIGFFFIHTFYFKNKRTVDIFEKHMNISIVIFFFLQTFHTPSFGDEEFDIPPINLPPTTPGSDTNSSDVYGSTHVRFFSYVALLILIYILDLISLTK